MRAKSFWSTALLLVMTTLVASAATIGRPATQQEPEPWVHVEVTSDGGTNMNLDLPLAAVTAMLALAPETIVQNGEFQFVTVLMRFHRTPTEVAELAAELGQHTETVLLDLGCSWDDITRLKDRGAII